MNTLAALGAFILHPFLSPLYGFLSSASVILDSFLTTQGRFSLDLQFEFPGKRFDQNVRIKLGYLYVMKRIVTDAKINFRHI